MPLVVLWLIRSVFKSIFGSRTPSRQTQTQAPAQRVGELKKDPVCGTYVPTDTSVTRTVNGEVLYFCSKECRDKYRVAAV